MKPSIDIVTVCYGNDISLLKTQAQSIDLYVNSLDINQITVVVNDDKSIVSLIDKSWYGQHQDKVVINHRSVYGEFSCAGWESQQLYKLFASAASDADWALVLDTKTWFVNSYNLDKAFVNNKACADFSHTFPDAFLSVKITLDQLFNIDVTSLIGPTGVPFYFKTQLVRDMITCVSELTNEDFSSYFIKNSIDNNGYTAITEFHLYSSYIIYAYKDYTNFYSRSNHSYHNININDVNIEDFSKSNFNAKNLLTVGVHPTAYRLLTNKNQQKWIDFLNSKGLGTVSYPKSD